jgi:hypothetical protein
MKICIIDIEPLVDCFVASSINEGLKKEYDNPEITWVVNGLSEYKIFSYTRNVKVLLYSDFCEMKDRDQYDILINFSPSIFLNDKIKVAKEYRGFNFNIKSSSLYDIVYKNKKSNMNIFQVYFNLAGLKWRGEGYGIKYYPKTKNKKNTIGVLTNNIKIQHYINDCLEVKNLKILPHKKNFFRHIDELNKCSHIITDDYLTMHLSIFLRKYVYFLKTLEINANLEFFGKGQVYEVPQQLLT